MESKPLRLRAGSRYYLEVLMKQGAGGENLSVAWEGPKLKQQVIQARYLSPFSRGRTLERPGGQDPSFEATRATAELSSAFEYQNQD